MKHISLKALLILVLLPMYLTMGIALFATGLDHTRDFLRQQLRNHAQDAASALALRLAPAFAANDMAAVASAVDALHDSGYYRAIVLERPGGSPVVSREFPLVVEQVPAWFMRLLPMEAPRGTAEVTTGWRLAAQVGVVSHPGHAYRQLWQDARDTLLWTLAFCLATIPILIWVINRALRPLGAMERLAIQVGEGRFPRLDAVPRVRELVHIGRALDHMSASVERMLDEKTRLIDQLRADLLHDPATGLANRAYFESSLDHALGQDAPRCGIALLRVEGLAELNAWQGREAGDRLINCVAAALHGFALGHGGSAARMDGAQFAMLLEDCERDTWREYAETLSLDLSQALDQVLAHRLPELGVDHGCALHVGTAWTREGDRPGLLARADAALRDARLGPSGSTRQADGPMPGREETRRCLRQALGEDALTLAWQPLVNCGDQALVHREAFARLTDAQGILLPAGAFIALAEEEGLLPELDRLVIARAWRARAANTRDACAVNVSAATLAGADFPEWLAGLAGEPSRLFLECTLGGAEFAPGVTRALARLKATGFPVVLDRFVPGARALEQMATLAPDWVKLEGGLCRHAVAHPGTRILLTTLCEYAHALGIRVAATGVEKEEDVAVLQSLGLDAVQGRVFDGLFPFQDGIKA